MFLLFKNGRKVGYIKRVALDLYQEYFMIRPNDIRPIGFRFMDLGQRLHSLKQDGIHCIEV